MIWGALLNIAFNTLFWSLDVFNLGDVVWGSEPAYFEHFFDYVRVGCYFFPLDTVLQIISIVIAFGLFRVGIRFVKTIWELLPFV